MCEITITKTFSSPAQNFIQTNCINTDYDHFSTCPWLSLCRNCTLLWPLVQPPFLGLFTVVFAGSFFYILASLSAGTCRWSFYKIIYQFCSLVFIFKRKLHKKLQLWKNGHKISTVKSILLYNCSSKLQHNPMYQDEEGKK